MRWCWPQTGFIVLIMVLGVLSMLGGCGKKGPLYKAGYKAGQDGPTSSIVAARTESPVVGSHGRQPPPRGMQDSVQEPALPE